MRIYYEFKNQNENEKEKEKYKLIEREIENGKELQGIFLISPTTTTTP